MSSSQYRRGSPRRKDSRERSRNDVAGRPGRGRGPVPARGKVDPYTVRRYVLALRAGATFPPLVVAAGSLVLVDGYHRARAYDCIVGPSAAVPVEVVAYSSRKAMIEDALARNAAHGRPYDARDHAWIALLARRHRIGLPRVAELLGLDPRWLAAKVRRRTATADGEDVPLKRTLEHLAGTALTPEQAACNEASGGMPLRYFADQVRLHVEAGAADLTHAPTVRALARLRDCLASLDLASPEEEEEAL